MTDADMASGPSIRLRSSAPETWHSRWYFTVFEGAGASLLGTKEKLSVKYKHNHEYD